MLTHYSGDYATYGNTVAEQKIAQMRLRVAYEKEKDKLREFISREGKKYDNPAHQAQVSIESLFFFVCFFLFGFFLCVQMACLTSHCIY